LKITFYSSTSEVLSEIGSRIKAARIAMPATQKEMAALANLSQRTISNLETGKDVSFSTVVEVLRALGQLQSLELMIRSKDRVPVRSLHLVSRGSAPAVKQKRSRKRKPVGSGG
jgi:transcriptional regulator with XRE-family HTH domain